jgi:hypothetical protein
VLSAKPRKPQDLKLLIRSFSDDVSRGTPWSRVYKGGFPEIRLTETLGPPNEYSGSAQACSGSAQACSPSTQVKAAAAHVETLKRK